MFCNQDANAQKLLGNKGFLVQNAKRAIYHRKRKISRQQLLKLHYDVYSLAGSRSMALTLQRYIKETPKYYQVTRKFVEDIRNKIVFLHEYNCQVAQVVPRGRYPKTLPMIQVLVNYVELEQEVIAKKESDDPKYRDIVQQRVIRLLRQIFGEIVANNVPNLKAVERSKLGAASIIKLLTLVRPEFRQSHTVVDKIATDLVTWLGYASFIEQMRGKHLPCSRNRILKPFESYSVFADLDTSDYESDHAGTESDVEDSDFSDTFKKERTDSQEGKVEAGAVSQIAEDGVKIERLFRCGEEPAPDGAEKPRKVPMIILLDDDDDDDGSSHMLCIRYEVPTRKKIPKEDSKAGIVQKADEVIVLDDDDDDDETGAVILLSDEEDEVKPDVIKTEDGVASANAIAAPVNDSAQIQSQSALLPAEDAVILIEDDVPLTKSEELLPEEEELLMVMRASTDSDNRTLNVRMDHSSAESDDSEIASRPRQAKRYSDEIVEIMQEWSEEDSDTSGEEEQIGGEKVPPINEAANGVEIGQNLKLPVCEDVQDNLLANAQWRNVIDEKQTDEATSKSNETEEVEEIEKIASDQESLEEPEILSPLDKKVAVQGSSIEEQEKTDKLGTEEEIFEKVASEKTDHETPEKLTLIDEKETEEIEKFATESMIDQEWLKQPEKLPSMDKRVAVEERDIETNLMDQESLINTDIIGEKSLEEPENFSVDRETDKLETEEEKTEKLPLTAENEIEDIEEITSDSVIDDIIYQESRDSSGKLSSIDGKVTAEGRDNETLSVDQESLEKFEKLPAIDEKETEEMEEGGKFSSSLEKKDKLETEQEKLASEKTDHESLETPEKLPLNEAEEVGESEEFASESMLEVIINQESSIDEKVAAEGRDNEKPSVEQDLSKKYEKLPSIDEKGTKEMEGRANFASHSMIKDRIDQESSIDEKVAAEGRDNEKFSVEQESFEKNDKLSTLFEKLASEEILIGEKDTERMEGIKEFPSDIINQESLEESEKLSPIDEKPSVDLEKMETLPLIDEQSLVKSDEESPVDIKSTEDLSLVDNEIIESVASEFQIGVNAVEETEQLKETEKLASEEILIGEKDTERMEGIKEFPSDIINQESLEESEKLSPIDEKPSVDLEKMETLPLIDEQSLVKSDEESPVDIKSTEDLSLVDNEIIESVASEFQIGVNAVEETEQLKETEKLASEEILIGEKQTGEMEGIKEFPSDIINQESLEEPEKLSPIDEKSSVDLEKTEALPLIDEKSLEKSGEESLMDEKSTEDFSPIEENIDGKSLSLVDNEIIENVASEFQIGANAVEETEQLKETERFAPPVESSREDPHPRGEDFDVDQHIEIFCDNIASEQVVCLEEYEPAVDEIVESKREESSTMPFLMDEAGSKNSYLDLLADAALSVVSVKARKRRRKKAKGRKRGRAKSTTIEPHDFMPTERSEAAPPPPNNVYTYVGLESTDTSEGMALTDKDILLIDEDLCEEPKTDGNVALFEEATLEEAIEFRNSSREDAPVLISIPETDCAFDGIFERLINAPMLDFTNGDSGSSSDDNLTLATVKEIVHGVAEEQKEPAVQKFKTKAALKAYEKLYIRLEKNKSCEVAEAPKGGKKRYGMNVVVRNSEQAKAVWNRRPTRSSVFLDDLNDASNGSEDKLSVVEALEVLDVGVLTDCLEEETIDSVSKRFMNIDVSEKSGEAEPCTEEDDKTKRSKHVRRVTRSSFVEEDVAVPAQVAERAATEADGQVENTEPCARRTRSKSKNFSEECPKSTLTEIVEKLKSKLEAEVAITGACMEMEADSESNASASSALGISISDQLDKLADKCEEVAAETVDDVKESRKGRRAHRKSKTTSVNIKTESTKRKSESKSNDADKTAKKSKVEEKISAETKSTVATKENKTVDEQTSDSKRIDKTNNAVNITDVKPERMEKNKKEKGRQGSNNKRIDKANNVDKVTEEIKKNKKAKLNKTVLEQSPSNTDVFTDGNPEVIKNTNKDKLCKTECQQASTNRKSDKKANEDNVTNGNPEEMEKYKKDNKVNLKKCNKLKAKDKKSDDSKSKSSGKDKIETKKPAVRKLVETDIFDFKIEKTKKPASKKKVEVSLETVATNNVALSPVAIPIKPKDTVYLSKKHIIMMNLNKEREKLRRESADSLKQDDERVEVADESSIAKPFVNVHVLKRKLKDKISGIAVNESVSPVKKSESNDDNLKSEVLAAHVEEHKPSFDAQAEKMSEDYEDISDISAADISVCESDKLNLKMDTGEIKPIEKPEPVLEQEEIKTEVLKDESSLSIQETRESLGSADDNKSSENDECFGDVAEVNQTMPNNIIDDSFDGEAETDVVKRRLSINILSNIVISLPLGAPKDLEINKNESNCDLISSPVAELPQLRDIFDDETKKEFLLDNCATESAPLQDIFENEAKKESLLDKCDTESASLQDIFENEAKKEALLEKCDTQSAPLQDIFENEVKKESLLDKCDTESAPLQDIFENEVKKKSLLEKCATESASLLDEAKKKNLVDNCDTKSGPLKDIFDDETKKESLMENCDTESGPLQDIFYGESKKESLMENCDTESTPLQDIFSSETVPEALMESSSEKEFDLGRFTAMATNEVGGGKDVFEKEVEVKDDAINLNQEERDKAVCEESIGGLPAEDDSMKSQIDFLSDSFSHGYIGNTPVIEVETTSLDGDFDLDGKERPSTVNIAFLMDYQDPESMLLDSLFTSQDDMKNQCVSPNAVQSETPADKGLMFDCGRSAVAGPSSKDGDFSGGFSGRPFAEIEESATQQDHTYTGDPLLAGYEEKRLSIADSPKESPLNDNKFVDMMRFSANNFVEDLPDINSAIDYAVNTLVELGTRSTQNSYPISHFIPDMEYLMENNMSTDSSKESMDSPNIGSDIIDPKVAQWSDLMASNGQDQNRKVVVLPAEPLTTPTFHMNQNDLVKSFSSFAEQEIFAKSPEKREAKAKRFKEAARVKPPRVDEIPARSHKRIPPKAPPKKDKAPQTAARPVARGLIWPRTNLMKPAEAAEDADEGGRCASRSLGKIDGPALDRDKLRKRPHTIESIMGGGGAENGKRRLFEEDAKRADDRARHRDEEVVLGRRRRETEAYAWRNASYQPAPSHRHSEHRQTYARRSAEYDGYRSRTADSKQPSPEKHVANGKRKLDFDDDEEVDKRARKPDDRPRSERDRRRERGQPERRDDPDLVFDRLKREGNVHKSYIPNTNKQYGGATSESHPRMAPTPTRRELLQKAVGSYGGEGSVGRHPHQRRPLPSRSDAPPRDVHLDWIQKFNQRIGTNRIGFKRTDLFCGPSGSLPQFSPNPR